MSVHTVDEGIVFYDEVGSSMNDAWFAYLPNGPSPKMGNGSSGTCSGSRSETLVRMDGEDGGAPGTVFEPGHFVNAMQVLLGIEPVQSSDQPIRLRKQIQRRLTADQQAELIERYLSGERAHLLAKAFEVNRETVAKLLKDQGFHRPRSLTSVEIAEAVALYADGWSCARIGAKLGRDPSTVRLALVAAGVRLRDPHGRDR